MPVRIRITQVPQGITRPTQFDAIVPQCEFMAFSVSEPIMFQARRDNGWKEEGYAISRREFSETLGKHHHEAGNRWLHHGVPDAYLFFPKRYCVPV